MMFWSGRTPTKNEPDNLRPIAPDARIFSLGSYVLMWWSSLIVIQAFVLGQGFLPPNGSMNFFQAFLVMVLAALVAVVMFSLNGAAGNKYGIPYLIQTRASFGVRGSKVVEFLRALPAIAWYGIGTWIAALSFDAILTTLIGLTAPWAKYVYFAALQAAQTWLAYGGIRTMKWFNVYGSLIITAVMTYMLVHIVGTYGFEIQESWRRAADWGPAFWAGLTTAIGILATVMLNIGDMTRHLESSPRSNWLGHLFGVLPPWFFMLSLGIIAGASLGIWDPVQALMQLSPNPGALVVLLTFILVAQFTTNLTINILPPALILMDTFKIAWPRAVVLTGVLGILSCPWLLLANMQVFSGFILYYSALFGPILGVMLADYYVVRQQRLVVEDLYVTDASSRHWYQGGFKVAALVAVAVPSAITMIWFLPVSWLVGLPVGFVLYLLLNRERSA
ncbi:MAG: cytosine permease [Steroidobacteraceae bacterium]